MPSSNQKRAKKAVKRTHVNFGVRYRIPHHNQRDYVTSLEVQHHACVQATCICYGSFHWWLNHSNDFVVQKNIGSSIVLVVKLCVDVVPSRGGHSQFSVVVLHAACQVTVWGTDRPVLYHYKGIKQGYGITKLSPSELEQYYEKNSPSSTSHISTKFS